MSNALSDTRSWLAAREDGVPGVLRAVMMDAIEEVGDTQTTPEAVLRAAADRLLAQTMQADAPTDPVVLLAADALITYLCEYRSEFQPGRLDTLL